MVIFHLLEAAASWALSRVGVFAFSVGRGRVVAATDGVQVADGGGDGRGIIGRIAPTLEATTDNSPIGRRKLKNVINLGGRRISNRGAKQWGGDIGARALPVMEIAMVPMWRRDP